MQDQLQVVPATTKEVFANHSYDAMWATEEVEPGSGAEIYYPYLTASTCVRDQVIHTAATAQ